MLLAKGPGSSFLAVGEVRSSGQVARDLVVQARLSNWPLSLTLAPGLRRVDNRESCVQFSAYSPIKAQRTNPVCWLLISFYNVHSRGPRNFASLSGGCGPFLRRENEEIIVE